MAERNEDGGCALEVVEAVMLLLKIFAASFVGSVLFVYACLAFVLQEMDPTMWPVGGRLGLVFTSLFLWPVAATLALVTNRARELAADHPPMY